MGILLSVEVANSGRLSWVTMDESSVHEELEGDQPVPLIPLDDECHESRWQGEGSAVFSKKTKLQGSRPFAKRLSERRADRF